MRRTAILGLLILTVPPALAQNSPMTPTATILAATSPAAPMPPWQAENQSTMARMNQAMMDSTGGANEDEAFVRGMLPHHQGAIDMARTELAYGRDPVLRHLAQRIIATQQQEIMEMRTWLLRHPAQH